jgi:hypothetical protein
MNLKENIDDLIERQKILYDKILKSKNKEESEILQDQMSINNTLLSNLRKHLNDNEIPNI